MKKVAILQSNYIPWKGYFDLIAAVDEFILYDDMQYTRRDWRNRNQIKTPQGVQWLTVPVINKGKYDQLIRETVITDADWAKKHWQSLENNYRRAPYFTDIAQWLAPLYTQQYTYLSALNTQFIQAICQYLNIPTKISSSADFTLKPGKTERLVDLCEQVNADEYISGPAAKDYLDPSLFGNIKLTWFDYNNYPTYPQLWGEFTHGVSIVDLLFNCGPKAPDYLRYL